MVKIRKIIIILFILGFTVQACKLVKTKPQFPYCPPVEQNCSPASWKGIPVDTSETYKNVAESYYIFESVKYINSPADEWGLSFLTPKRAIMTYSDANSQKLLMLRLPRENEGTIESGVGVSMNYSVGSITIKNNDIAFAAITLSDSELTGNSDIYTGKIIDNRIFGIKKLDNKINRNYTTWESQPAFSPLANVIFFVSDYGSERHGTDIWFSIKLPDSSWSEAINCGENVNSRCDELTPFVDNDGKRLYFASSGHVTVGGYDIFFSDIDSSFWSDVKKFDIEKLKSKNYFGDAVNMRPPLNTPADELFPSSPGHCDEFFYYSSNQMSNNTGNLVLNQGGFDIFVRRKVEKTKFKNIAKPIIASDSFDVKEFKPDLKTNFNINLTYKIEGTVFNASNNSPIPNTEITAKNINDLNSIVSDSIFTDNHGNYSLTLEKNKYFEITANADNFFFDSYKLRIDSEDTTSIIRKDFYIPILMTLRINFPNDVYNDPYRFTLDSNGIETNRSWNEELDLLANNIIASKDKILKVELAGHTDDVASIAYNQALGQRRVNFVISELIKRGVPKEMLEGRSAGKLEPLPKRQNEDLETYRKRLRRVELQKVLK